MKVVAKSNFFGQGTSFRTGREYEVADKFGKVLVEAGKVEAVKVSTQPAPATTSTPASTAPSTTAQGDADKGEVVSDDEATANAKGGDQTDGEADKEPTTGETDKTNAKKGSK